MQATFADFNGDLAINVTTTASIYREFLCTRLACGHAG